VTPDQKSLLKQPHFWMMLFAVTIGAVKQGFGDAGIPLPKLVLAVMSTFSIAISGIAYGLAALWQPARVPWTPDQRAARGLDPYAGPAAPPPLPPPLSSETTKP
jgi:hypothetical protein